METPEYGKKMECWEVRFFCDKSARDIRSLSPNFELESSRKQHSIALS